MPHTTPARIPVFSEQVLSPARHPAAAVRPFYSQAVRTGRFLFTGGLIGTVGDDPVIPGTSMADQTQAVLENMQAILAAAGLTFRNVLRVTVFITDRREFQAMNAVYSTYFAVAPARTCSTVAALYPGAKVAMSAIATFEGEAELVSTHGVAPPEDHPALAGLAAGARKPFHCQGIRSPSLLCLSGVVGTEPQSAEIKDPTIEGQTRKALYNLTETLAAAGLGARDVANVLILLQDRGDFAAMNRVYTDCFADAPPARCCVTEGEHYPGSRIEIVAIAGFEGAPAPVLSPQVAAPRNHPALPAGARPFYSQAMCTPDLMFVSGMLGTEPGRFEIADPTIEGQTHKALENMQQVLTQDGLTLDDLVSTAVFLRDRADYEAMTRVYAACFAGSPPARSCAAMYGLHPGARVQICGIAARR
ncbi:MAG: RidA family protein [Alphaproteobacteria bacterium]